MEPRRKGETMGELLDKAKGNIKEAIGELDEKLDA